VGQVDEPVGAMKPTDVAKKELSPLPVAAE